MTLDPDVAARLKQIAAERGLSFKEVLNSTLRAGLAPRGSRSARYRLPTFKMGLRPGVDLDRALRLAESMEDQETLRKLELRK